MKKLNKFMFAAMLSAISISSVYAQSPRVTVTVAGNGAAGFNGNAKPGNLATINGPHDICMDPAGNIYFADQANYMIRKIDARGIITTVAGGGSSVAEGVPATSASVNPYYICRDLAGNLYFSTYGLVRKIDAATGLINTIAGTGMTGYMGTTGYSGDGGPATAAMIQGAGGICADAAGNIYIADGTNNRVRMVSAATGIITTICGTGAVTASGDGGPALAAAINTPSLISTDAAGDLFIYESGTLKIRKISAATGIINAFAGGGSTLFGCLALDAQLDGLSGMCVDDSGDVFCDETSCSCRKIDLSSDSVFAVAGNYYIEGYSDDVNSVLANMNTPYGLCADGAGNVYIADAGNNRIRKSIQLTNTPTFAYGIKQSILSCPATAKDINSPLAITDLDAGQPETWTVISAPVNGTLSGFPYTMTSTGPDALITPAGLAYTPATGFSGNDSFQVRVSDGTLSDIVTIYVSVPTTTPDAGVISSVSHVCVSNTIDFNDPAPDGVWSAANANLLFPSGATTGSATSMVANTAGVDTIYYSVTGGCTSVAMMVVTVDAIPDPGAIMGDYFVDAGNTTVLSDASAGGVWSSSDNSIATVSSTGVVTGVSAGGCYISYTVYAGACSADSSIYFTVNPVTTGVNKVTTSVVGGLSVVPNPNKGNFAITVSSACNEVVTITITNVTGQKVMELNGYANQPIETSLNVASGVYLLNAVTSHGKLNGKIIIE